MKLFRRVKRKKDNVEVTEMRFQGDTATAARAMYQGPKAFPTILLTFTVDHGRDPETGTQFDQLEIELDIHEAAAFGDALLAAISVSIPRMPSAAGRYQYGE